MTKYDLVKIHKAIKRLAEIAEELNGVAAQSVNHDMAFDVVYTTRMLTHIQESLTEIAGAYPVQE